MNTMKVIGFVAGGLVLAAVVGGGIVWWRRRKAKTDKGFPKTPKRAKPGPTPSKPPRPPEVEDTSPRGHFQNKAELSDEFRAALDERFPEGWPADDATIDSLTQEDVIIFAVESEPTGNYTETREELITAKVRSVEKTVVRARIVGPVAHAEHFGAHAGHGFRVGDLVEVPRSKVLVAARPTDPKRTGYGSQGKPAQTFKPSNRTKEIYRVRPETPYDLVLPYRTPELQWYVDEKLVTMEHIGQKANLEQIQFTEDSLRGNVSVRALDEDSEHGTVFVARWDFELDA